MCRASKHDTKVYSLSVVPSTWSLHLWLKIPTVLHASSSFGIIFVKNKLHIVWVCYFFVNVYPMIMGTKSWICRLFFISPAKICSRTFIQSSDDDKLALCCLRIFCVVLYSFTFLSGLLDLIRITLSGPVNSWLC